jgi:hypothetical protein
VTTTTASVVPAPRPAERVKLISARRGSVSVSARTNEDVPKARLARLLVRQPSFVVLERRKAHGHFGYDAGEDGAETFVQRERGLASCDHDTGRDEPAGFRLVQRERHSQES